MRLEAYYEAISILFTKNHNTNDRGSITDFFDLLRRSNKARYSSMKGALKRMAQGDEFQEWAYGTTIEQAQAKANKKAIEVYTESLCSEVESLQHTRLFGEYRSDKILFAKELRQRDYQECITTNTPELAKLLAKLCTNKRASLDRVVLESRLPTIIQILAFSRHQRHCNFLPAITGVVAHSKGLPRTLFNVLNAMGITESYNTTLDTIAGMKALGKTTILDSIVKWDGMWLFVYDNLDFSIGVREQTSDRLVRPQYRL
jgi:hypothetical protein